MPTLLLSDPLIALPSAFGLALLLLGAAAHKLRQPDAFAAVLRGYGILSDAAIAPLRVLIPLVEAGLALGLLIPATRQVCALPVALLLLAYGAAMAYTLGQGRRVADCGCGFGKSGNPVSAALVWRNIVLVLLALNLAQASAARSLGAYDLAAVVFSVLIGATLYALANTLIANQHTSRKLFHD